MSWSSGLNSPPVASVLASSTPHPISKTHATSPEDVPAKGTNKKRKNAAQESGNISDQKRLKPMGRPRNGWTPTRKRKLVRLYLMTELNVGEIAEVLRAKHFQPCKRDIQTQLNTLLSSRPNRLRAKGPITKARLQLLRECKSVRSAERMKKANLNTASDIGTSERYASESSEPLSSSTTEPAFNSWLDFDLLDGTSTATQSPYIQSGSSPLENSTNFKYFEAVDEHSLMGPWKTEKESSVGLYDIDSVLGLGDYEPIILSEPGLEEWTNSEGNIETTPRRTESEYTELPLTREDRERTLQPVTSRSDDLISEPLGRTLSNPEDTPTPRAIKPEKDDSRSILSNASMGTTRSVLSLRSLKKRLQSKYTTSFLGDIKSLMERLTISEASEVSSTMTGRTSSSKTQSRISVPTKRLEHPVILPGSFPQYCWEHINHNELRKCDDINNPCDCGPIFQLIGLETHRSIRSDVLFRIRACSVREDDLEDVDTFNNSVLHIAAALEAPPSYLLRLISMGADVHALNNGHQTFLHHAHVSSAERIADLRTLIGTLVKRKFDFKQADFNGQTAIHALTEPPLSFDILNGIVQVFNFHAIDLPTSRDNLGFRIQDQLQELEAKPTLPVFEDARFSVDAAFFPEQPESDNRQFEELSFVERNVQSFQKHEWVQNLDDLQQYEMHADLLRSIVRAGDEPLSEDSEGRNGLHCLAEVRLDLPLPSSQSDRKPASAPIFSMSSRERYLEQLLIAGVDPNEHDKQGLTPFMAFIIYPREGEDDDMKTKIYQRLFDAGADVHRRNRHGESPLHLAVKVGNRAATNFLLSHGANVHARTSAGSGVMTVGLKHSSSSKAAKDEVLYAQISLCTVQVGEAGGIAAPTILHEWGSSSFRIRPDRTPSVGHDSTLQKKNSRISYFK